MPTSSRLAASTTGLESIGVATTGLGAGLWGVGGGLATMRARPRVDASETTVTPGPIPSPPALHPHRPARRAPVAAPGRRLGPYRLIERIGRGRQADVWRALRSAPPVKEVALKVLPVSSIEQDPRRLAQLRREAERGSRLVSPSLLPTYDFGEADGLVFLAMPLVVGCTLATVLEHRRDHIARKSLPKDAHTLAQSRDDVYVPLVVGLLARVARAVAAAHAARVVHRDIKPMNILVSHASEPRVGPAEFSIPGVYLCDFGLARDLDVATPMQLRDGAGSPLYMAPERLLRRYADEFRCDVFALGVTLFEVLTLAPPIEVPPELPRTRWAAFLATTPPRHPRELRPDMPEPLQSAILQATHRDPDLRHESAAHFADVLDRWLANAA